LLFCSCGFALPTCQFRFATSCPARFGSVCPFLGLISLRVNKVREKLESDAESKDLDDRSLWMSAHFLYERQIKGGFLSERGNYENAGRLTGSDALTTKDESYWESRKIGERSQLESKETGFCDKSGVRSDDSESFAVLCPQKFRCTLRKSFQKRPGRTLQGSSRKEMAGTIVSACIFIGLVRCQETYGCGRAPSEVSGTAGRKESWLSVGARTVSSFTQPAFQLDGVNTAREKNCPASTAAAIIERLHRSRAQSVSGGSLASSSTGGIAGAALPL
jgi:hypothetical protein